MITSVRHRIIRFLPTIYLGYAVLCLLSAFFSVTDTHDWWFAGLVGIGIPYLFFFLFLATIVAVLNRSRYAIVGLVVGVLSWSVISPIISLGGDHTIPPRKQAGRIRVMTWNVSHFRPYGVRYYRTDQNNLESIFAELEVYQPDILCLQEFFKELPWGKRILHRFVEKGYVHIAFVKLPQDKQALPRRGNIILSKFPIVSKDADACKQVSPYTWDPPVFVQVKVGEDTIRIGNFHLRSYRFLPRDYQDMAKIKQQEDAELKASKNIFRKMRSAFKDRSIQAKAIADEASRSRYPLILCGDLNDVPSSFAYQTMRGNRQDAFLEAGMGLGKTYISGQSRMLALVPTLRIDYLFADPRFKVEACGRVREKISDHRGVVADFELVKKR